MTATSEAPEILWRPQAGPQKALVDCPFPEIFFGGARGGGKTDGVLGKWAIKEQRYGRDFNAIMFRRTTVSSEDAIERSKQIYTPLGGKFNESTKVWRMPNGGRVAFALQAAGWWLRSDIIWAKGLSFCPTYAGSAMPESVTDRPTKGHEYLFLLTKSERYFYDIEAVKENAVGAEPGNVTHKGVTAYSNGDGHHRTKAGLLNMGASTRRNLRTVWAINPGSYPEAHFATFPPALVEPCVLAGTSAHGVCPACGAPWVRVVERGEPVARPDNPNAVMPYGAASGHTNGQGATTLHKLRTVETTGWQPSCNCDAGEPIPATVLDPFAGSGTTLAVAVEHKRSGIGIELNPAYVDLIHKRLGTVQPRLFNL